MKIGRTHWEERFYHYYNGEIVRGECSIKRFPPGTLVACDGGARGGVYVVDEPQWRCSRKIKLSELSPLEQLAAAAK